MILDQRLTLALHRVADDVLVPQVDVGAVRSTARAQRVRRSSVVATAAAALVLVAASTVVGGRDTTAPEPATTSGTQSSTSSTSSRQPSLLTFTSSLYDVSLQYPDDWTPYAATQRWTWQTNAKDWEGPAQDHLLSPHHPRAGEVRVSVWKAPIDPGARNESTAYLVAFAEDYCAKAGNSPCTGIADRAVGLCVEQPCHPGLLVPFKEDVQAFFSGGTYGQDAMTIVAVWRPEWDSSVRAYGGSRQLLEAFLETMDVRPDTRPS